ncbi:serine/threonine protein kinase [bacterium AH-315-E10]|nr:serine/threonine protein kinase [bacterium AH-315-E10]MBN4073967.1 serine/threonine protein kinase [bacterium AH-315-E10]
MLNKSPIHDDFGDLEVPGYEILDFIGKGAQGVVVSARQTKLDRDVALKIIRNDDDSRDTILRLEREARALASLDHPNIVGCHDILQLPGFTVLVMDFIPGGVTVGSLIREFGLLPEETALEIIRQIIGGLKHAHTKGIIHRDIKAENLLLRFDPEIKLDDSNNLFSHPETRVKIVDFGLSITVRPDVGGNITSVGYVVGTPLYMAPEQVTGIDVDFRTDIYALGVCLFYMLSGTLPNKSAKVSDIITKKMENPAPAVNLANPKINEQLSQFTQQMMATNPNDRFASYDECLKGLEQKSPIKKKTNIYLIISVVFLAILSSLLLILAFLLTDPKLAPMSPSEWQQKGSSWQWGVASDEDSAKAILGTPGDAIHFKSVLSIPIRIDMKVRLIRDGHSQIIFNNKNQNLFYIVLERMGDNMEISRMNSVSKVGFIDFKKPSHEWIYLSIRCYKGNTVIFADDVLAGNIVDDKKANSLSISLLCKQGEIQFKDIKMTYIPED